MKPKDGRQRVVIEDVIPLIDSGGFSVRRVCGDEVRVTAAVFSDGKDEVAARVLYRHASGEQWQFATMRAAGNDLWNGTFVVDKLGAWSFTVLGWVDHFGTWASELKKRIAAQSNLEPTDAIPVARLDGNSGLRARSNPTAQDVTLALRSGALLIRQAAERARGDDTKRLGEIARELEQLAEEKRAIYDNPCTEELLELMARYPDLTHATRFEPDLPLWVDRQRARFFVLVRAFSRGRRHPFPASTATSAM